jgi:hypothetical protein
LAGSLRADVGQDAHHVFLRLADRQAADRQAGEIDLFQSGQRFVAQVLEHAALDDAEQRVRVFAAVEFVIERCAQRSDMRIDFAASSRVAGRPSISYGVHSSNCITMSEFSTRWICIETSGDRNSLSPLIGEAKCTPSSVILRIAPSENTWKPPESVRIGPCPSP